MHRLEILRALRAALLVANAIVLLVYAASSQRGNPTAVISSFERAWSQQDFDGALAQFADTATITVHDPRTRVLASQQQIREFLQINAAQGVPIPTSTSRVQGNSVTWTERTDAPVWISKDSTVQATVVNGKIQSLVYDQGTKAAAAGHPSGVLTAESAGMNLGAVALFGLACLSLTTLRPRSGSGSVMRGRLMRDLSRWQPSGHQVRAA